MSYTRVRVCLLASLSPLAVYDCTPLSLQARGELKDDEHYCKIEGQCPTRPRNPI